MFHARFRIGLLAAVCLAVGCAETAAPPTDSDVLRRGNGGEPVTLDPALAEDEHAFRVLADLYEGLIATDASGAPVPGVAESWDVSPDGLDYTFHLRDSARWSNGAAVTAHDFVAAFRKVLSPNSQSPYVFLLEPIRNSDKVRAGELSPADLGVSAVGSSTLLVKLAYPAPYFIDVLAMPVSFPVFSDSGRTDSVAASSDVAVSNGPYMIESSVPGDKIRLRRNPHFHDVTNVDIEFVEYFPVVDADAEYRLYRSGELDITATVPAGAIEGIRRSRPGELFIAPRLALYYVAFDVTEPPFDNRDLRQALTMAIDREALVEILGRGEQPAYGLVPPGIEGYENPSFKWQVEASNERLAEARGRYAMAGYSESTPLVAEFLYDAGGVHETIALAITAMWREVLGADVKLRKMEWQQFLATRENRADWQMMRFAWTGDYPDPKTFTDLFRSDSRQNLPAWKDATYDEFLRKADAELTPSVRLRTLGEAESVLLAANPIAPLYFYVSKHLVNPRVQGFHPNLLDQHPTRHLSLTTGR